MGISNDSIIILATPKSQNQGMVMGNAYCLLNDHNTEYEFLAKPRRAKLKAPSFVVMLLVKGQTISCKASLESGRFKFRRINIESLEVPTNAS